MTYHFDSTFHLFRRLDGGNFSYSDGAEAETRLLTLVTSADDRSTFSPELAASITDWVSEYHLSKSRHCLLRPLGIQAGNKVLELGCGCGAITRFLGEVGADVVAVEGSLARAHIAAERCRDLANVRIIVDDLLRFETEERFDFIFLIGVLEYAAVFSDYTNPFEHNLRAVAHLLGPDGKLVVAIENKLGLKYFNGCGEDHVGAPFFGIQDLYQSKTVRTFGRRELIAQLCGAGLSHVQFYYPFPDYKLPSVILSEAALNDKRFDAIDLLARCHARDYTGHPFRSFDDALAAFTLQSNGLLADLSNSFLVTASAQQVLTNAPVELATSFSVHRAAEFCTQTKFVLNGDGIQVQKEYLTGTPQQPIVLSDGLTIRHRLDDSAYRPGRQLLWKLLKTRARTGDSQGIVEALRPWMGFLLQHARVPAGQITGLGEKPSALALYRLPATFVDCTPFNVLETNSGLFAIDLEWMSDSEVSLGWVIARGVFYSLLAGVPSGNSPISHTEITNALCCEFGLSASEQEFEAWIEQEKRFQAAVRRTAAAVKPAIRMTPGLRTWQSQIVRLNQALAGRDDQLTSAYNTIGTRDGQLADAHQALASRDEQLVSLNRTIDDREQELARIRERFERAQEEIGRAQAEISHTQEEVGRAQQEVGRAQQEIGRAKTEIGGLQHQILTLRNQLGAIEASTSWKVTRVFRAALSSHPRLRLAVRRSLRIAYWTATLQLPQRLRVRRRLQKEHSQIADSPFFDAEWYLREYPDVAAAAADPSLHYTLYGATERRNPGPIFDAAWYCEQNPDVAASGMNPLLHYIQFGATEGRKIHAVRDYTPLAIEPDLSNLQVDPRHITLIERSGLFHGSWYLNHYPDLHHAQIDPAIHYLAFGWKEMRNPGPLFDTGWYLQQYPDVSQGSINPLVHFLQVGIFEGRFPSRAVADSALPEKYMRSVRSYFAASTHNFHNIGWVDASTPQVSIIILNFNKAYLTLQCLSSLWEYTSGRRYEILVVDNGSAADDLELLSTIKGPFGLLRLSVNRYFGEGNNIGAEAARGEILVFMNNDVVATADWLPPLVDALDNQPTCGAAGPKFVYPDGRLQEAGALIRQDGTALQRGKNGDPRDPEFNSPQVVDYVSAATVAVRKADFERVFGFDFRWEPAYYEDVDLCLKLAGIGLQTCYIPSSMVIHCENSTSSDKQFRLRLDNIVDINRSKFLERWETYLITRDTKLAEKIVGPPPQLPSPRQGLEKPRVALFTPYAMIPGGGERYLLTIAESLLPQYDLSLVTPERYSCIRISTIARLFDLSLANLHLTTLKSHGGEKPADVWITIGNSIIPPEQPLGRHNLFLLQFPFPIGVHRIEEGGALWNQYERVIVYSDYVKGHVQKLIDGHMLSKREIDIIPPPIAPSPALNPLEKRPGFIINVGRFFSGGHCKRQDLLIDAFRCMVRQNSNLSLELHLVGSLHPEPEHREYFLLCKRLAEGLPVYFHLDAGARELEDLYRSASLYWHATGIGVDLSAEPEKAEHFGISVVEAMSAGCIPIVYAEGGPADIVEDGLNGYHFREASELEAITLRLVEQSAQPAVETMRLEARKRASCYDKILFSSRWRQVVEDVRVGS